MGQVYKCSNTKYFILFFDFGCNPEAHFLKMTQPLMKLCKLTLYLLSLECAFSLRISRISSSEAGVLLSYYKPFLLLYSMYENSFLYLFA